MKTGAAVAFAAGDAQEIPELDLEGPSAGAGQEIATRLSQRLTDRSLRGTAFGARWRTDISRLVDWYMDGKIEIDPLSTHKMPLEDINQAFDLMHTGNSIRQVVIN
tara:strand:- start:79 stop:396 length:318 start_codon:yes stop_codon:yes gene_type:complete